jgi:hypothetical protein
MSPPAAALPDAVRSALDNGARSVEAFRLWRGYTVADLGWLSGITASEIAEHERGDRELSAAEIRAIAAALAVPVRFLTA